MGLEDVHDAGRWLVSQGLGPVVAVVSPAARTRQTFESLERGGVTASEVRQDTAIYNGSQDDLVEAVSIVEDSCDTVVLVGHAPAVPGLATVLPSRCGTPAGWPPATLGVVAHPGSWADFPGPDTRLVAWWAPGADSLHPRR